MIRKQQLFFLVCLFLVHACARELPTTRDGKIYRVVAPFSLKCCMGWVDLSLAFSLSPSQVTLYTYNWSVDLGASLNRGLVRLVQWQNARAHVVHCLLNQKMGLFHHCCFSDTPAHTDLKQVNVSHSPSSYTCTRKSTVNLTQPSFLYEC